jgi:hypothetical protein
MNRKKPARRSVVRTVLVVGEGNSEVLFVKHLLTLYGRRGGGVRVTVKNARGKGAANVVDVAIRHSRNAAYDVCAALLDTDVGWNQTTEQLAHKGGVRVLSSTPCLEALLLEIHQMPLANRSSAQLKAAFAAQFGKPATDPLVYVQHFALSRLTQARLRVVALHRLLTLLETGHLAT